MKLILTVFTIVCLYTMPSIAQSLRTPEWMCGKGFWVIKTNKSTPKNAVIYFYTNERELVYKEEVNGKRINPDRIKTRKHLEAVLNTAILTWQREGLVKENQHLVATKR